MYLHWILALMVTLLHCFTAKPINTFSDIKTTIDILKNQSCNEHDSTFYSPSGDNRCHIQALNCSVEELKVVKSECFEPNHRNAQLVNKLRDLIKRMLQKNTVQGDSKSCPCEKEPRMPYKEFLENIHKLVQMVNSLPKKTE